MPALYPPCLRRCRAERSNLIPDMETPLKYLTVADLRHELTKAELAAIPGNVVAGDDANAVNAWLLEKLAQACDRVILAVNSCAKNQRIKSGLQAVPAGCTRTALVLARHAVISAIPGMAETLEGSSRAAEYSAALADLSALASCSLQPDYTLTDSEADEPNDGDVVLVLGEKASNFLW